MIGADSPSTGDPASAQEYAGAQADLVAALTGTGSVPVGFDPIRLEVARKALLRKRAGAIATMWPDLRAAMGDRFAEEFATWAKHRPTAGSFRDGWDFAADLEARSALPAASARELAERRLLWIYDGASDPRRRRLPRLALVQGHLLLQCGGRVRAFAFTRRVRGAP